MNEWPGTLTRIDAIRIIENITDKDDPAWEWAVEDFYDEDTDTMPTIYDVLSILGVTEDEYKKATGAQNTNWPEVELDYAVEKETEIDKLYQQLTAANARVEALEDRLVRSGFVRCDLPACNCGSWHQRYGLPERWRKTSRR